MVPSIAPVISPTHGAACISQFNPVARPIRKSPSPCPNRTSIPVTKVRLTGIFPARRIDALSAPIANTIGSTAVASTPAIASNIVTPLSTQVIRHLPVEVRENLPRGRPEHENCDQLGDSAGLAVAALANGHRELGAVAAHIGDEETAEMQVPDRIDHAGERRQQPRHRQAAHLLHDKAAINSDRLLHRLLSEIRHLCQVS